MESLILGTTSMAAQSLSLPSTLSSSRCISGFSLSISPQNLAISSSSPSPSLPPIYCGRGFRKSAKGKRFAHSFGNKNPVVVYSKSWCSYSSEVKSLFKKLGADPLVIELDDLGKRLKIILPSAKEDRGQEADSL